MTTTAPAPEGDALLADALAHYQAKRFASAERLARAVLAADPTHPHALQLLGMLAGQAGHLRDAIVLFERALARASDDASIYHNIGESWRHLGNYEKAYNAFHRALELRPEHLEAYRSFAELAQAEAQRYEQAGQSKIARELRVEAAVALCRLGQRLALIGGKSAEKYYRDAVALAPKSPEPRALLSLYLVEANRPSEAAAVARSAIALDPAFGQGYFSLGYALYHSNLGREAGIAFRQALARSPDMAPAQQGLDATRLMIPIYHERDSTRIFAEHKAWGLEAMAKARPAPFDAQPFPNTRDPLRRLRVGFVSPDLRRHSVAYFVEPLLANPDAMNLEFFCYSDTQHPDKVSERLRGMAAHWLDSHALSHEEFRRQVRRDEIDILIDLAGHTSGNRLYALSVRAAPVMATWLGYPATTGLPTIDWRITDAVADPPGAESLHTERLIRMDEGFLCYRPASDLPDPAPSPALAAGHVTFGSFNNHAKVTPEVLAVWGRLLHALPDARLVIKTPMLRDPELRGRLEAQFAAAGGPVDRLELRRPIASWEQHLGSYQDIDIALDPFPYNGTTTTCEAMWMGVPVVTLAGDRHSSRVGLSILSQLDLAEFAAADEDAYVRTACGLAADLPRLAALRGSLRDRMRGSTLCDEGGFARRFEAALRAIWREWCAA